MIIKKLTRQVFTITLLVFLGVLLLVGGILTVKTVIVRRFNNPSYFTAALSGSTTLKVVTNVINTHGGTKSASDFVVRLTYFYHDSITNQDVVVTENSTAGSTTGTTYTLNLPLSMQSGSGYFTVSQDKNPAYIEIFSGDCLNGGGQSIAAGDQKTCTITNYDVNQTASCGYYGFDELTPPGTVTYSDEAMGSGYFLVPGYGIYPSTTETPSKSGLARSAVGTTLSGVGVGSFSGGIPPKFSHLQSGNTLFG